MSRLILFHFTFLCLLLRRNWKMPISSHWNNSVFCDQWKMMSYLNMSYGKISHLCSLTHKAKKFRFWKPLKYLFFYKKRYDADLNMSHGKRYDADLNMSHGKRYDVIFEYVPWKNAWFCFIATFWVHFSHKTEKPQF